MGANEKWDEVARPTEKVIHVVGCATDEVFSFLGPATSAIAHSGASQVVIMIDDPRFRRNLARFHDSVNLVLTPKERNPYTQWVLILRAFEAQIGIGPVRAVHLHGFLPYVVCGAVLRGQFKTADVFFSPHASRSIGTLPVIGRALVNIGRAMLGRPRSAAIVNQSSEAVPFQAWEAADLVECPAPDEFFKVSRNEARNPLVVCAGRDESAQNVERFAQFSVLLGGQDVAIAFNWIGTLSAMSTARLAAANVAVFDEITDDRVASRIASGWVFLAAGPVRGFPIALVQAMAVGLPCVALECPQYAAIIKDGETGFLCSTERQMIERIATLLDNKSLRIRMGSAAREYAKKRFMQAQFEEKLLSAYAQKA